MNIFEIQKFEDFKFISRKENGIERGGIFLKDNTKYMLKYMETNYIAAEYIGSNLANLLFFPNQAPQVYLVIDTDGDIYTASKFLDNFKTHYEGLKEEISFDQIKEVEERNLISRFLGHNDEHPRNFGYVETGEVKKAAVVDFSRSMRYFSETLLYSSWDGGNKINLTINYISALKKISQLDVKTVLNMVDELFKTLNNVFKSTEEYHKNINDLFKERIELCKKEGLIGDFLINISSKNELAIDVLSPWIKNSGLFEEFQQYATWMLKELMDSNDKTSFSFLMPYIKQEVIETLFLQTIILSNKEFFSIMVPYIVGKPELIKDAFNQSLLSDNILYFDKLFSYRFPEYMKEINNNIILDISSESLQEILIFCYHNDEFIISAFIKSLELGYNSLFNNLLPLIILNEYMAVERILNRVIKLEKHISLKKLLPYLNDEVMKESFEKAIALDKYDHFKEMLPFMTSENMKEEFKKAIWWDKHHYFEEMVSYMTSKHMVIGFSEAIRLEKYNYFKEMLPYINSENMKEEFKKSIWWDKHKYFEEMLPYMTSESMNYAFEVAIWKGKYNYFKEMLPYMNSKDMKAGFNAAIKHEKYDYFNEMLTHMNPEAMINAFETTIKLNKFEYFEKMLPFMSSETIDKALAEAISQRQNIYVEKIEEFKNASFKLVMETFKNFIISLENIDNNNTSQADKPGNIDTTEINDIDFSHNNEGILHSLILIEDE